MIAPVATVPTAEEVDAGEVLEGEDAVEDDAAVLAGLSTLHGVSWKGQGWP